MSFQLKTLEQLSNMDFMPTDNYSVWKSIGTFKTYQEACDFANNYVDSFAQIQWVSFNQHLDVGFCTPLHHPHRNATRRWFKIFGVK